ncbi:hypothetical protein B9T33_15135 [Acinetobacter sp. ANC 5054]|nr:hypothetical protein B9T33_15135 [Acinetobacter sp. ANC 5054]
MSISEYKKFKLSSLWQINELFIAIFSNHSAFCDWAAIYPLFKIQHAIFLELMIIFGIFKTTQLVAVMILKVL